MTQQESQTELGARLRIARQSMGLTLAGVGQQIGMSQSYLSDLERGTLENPTIDTVRRLAGVLNVTVAELIGDPGPEPDPDMRKVAHAAQEEMIRHARAMLDSANLVRQALGLDTLYIRRHRKVVPR